MKKLLLSKETLRRLSPEMLGRIQGGIPAETYTCDLCADPTDTCTQNHTTTILPTITHSITLGA